jgi:ribosomal-protein-alanine N-acetyltransferase
MGAEVPTITTERLVLNTFARADVPAIFAYASNPNVALRTSFCPHNSLADSEAFLAWRDKVSFDRGRQVCHIWAIRERAAPAAIGSIDFSNYEKGEGVGRIDYALSEPFWGKGYMTEAARAVVAWAFRKFPNLGKIESSFLEGNVGSRRVMEKCGMKYVGESTAQFDKHPQPVKCFNFEVLRTNNPGESNG